MTPPVIDPPPGAGASRTGATAETNPHSGSHSEIPENPLWGFLRQVRPYVQELKAYFSYWLSAQRDRVKLKIRNLALMAALGVIGLLAGVTVIVMAVVLLMIGIARGLGEAFALATPRIAFLGPLLVGVIVLAGIGWGAVFMMNRLFKTSKRKTTAKYAEKRAEQKVQFGHNVTDRANQAAEQEEE